MRDYEDDTTHARVAPMHPNNGDNSTFICFVFFGKFSWFLLIVQVHFILRSNQQQDRNLKTNTAVYTCGYLFSFVCISVVVFGCIVTTVVHFIPTPLIYHVMFLNQTNFRWMF